MRKIYCACCEHLNKNKYILDNSTCESNENEAGDNWFGTECIFPKACEKNANNDCLDFKQEEIEEWRDPDDPGFEL